MRKSLVISSFASQNYLYLFCCCREGIIEHESEGVSKRRKSLVLNQDLEEKIKGLYEK